MKPLEVRSVPYPERKLAAWRKGRYGFLQRSNASRYIRRILCEKAGNRRPDARFFGEAFVAATTKHSDGWYGSFKWLTAPRYVSLRSLQGYQEEYAQALHRHFRGLDTFQAKAHRLAARLGEKPVPPDLWLIVRGKHHFIEVKLPRDSVTDRQLAGLALIARQLRSDRPIRISVVQLYPESRPMPGDSTLGERFRSLYRLSSGRRRI